MNFSKKRKVFILANCQGRAIKTFFRNVERLNNMFDVFEIKPIHLLSSIDKNEIYEAIKNTDIFIYQPISERFGEYSSNNLISHLRTEAIIISFPVIYFSGYNPESIYLKDENNKKVNSFVDYHDINLLNAYHQKVDSVEFIHNIQKPDFYSDSICRSFINDSISELKRREQDIDITIHDIISDSMMGERLFYSMNHPSNFLLFIIFNKILKHLGIEELKEIEKANFSVNMLGRTMLYIYPQVANMFELKINFKLKINNEIYELKQLVDKYYSFYDNNRALVEINLDRCKGKNNIVSKILATTKW